MNRSFTKFEVILISAGIMFTSAQHAVAQKPPADDVKELASQISASANITKQPKKKIAVIPFRELGSRNPGLGIYLSEALVTELFKLDKVNIVERSMLDKVLDELRRNGSSAFDPSIAKSVGKMVGADAVMLGSILEIQTYIAVNCRLIDTERGDILAVAETRISGPGTSNPPDPGVSGKTPTFETDSYRIEVQEVKRSGKTVVVTLVVENVSDKVLCFGTFNSPWFLFDENGERLITRTPDTALFHTPPGEDGRTTWDVSNKGVEIPTKAKLRSKFVFAGAIENTGKHFTLSAGEIWPQNGRKIVIKDLTLE